jgi:hypothetical protein
VYNIRIMQLMDSLVINYKPKSDNQFSQINQEKLIHTINILKMRDIAIPVDLQARAVAEGIDVEAILKS